MFKKILMILSLLIVLSSTYAVSDVEISPESPVVGDTIVLTGKTNPNGEVSCSAWFEINPIISQPYYGALLYDVSIPEPQNNFKVTAENVQNLAVSINMGFWVTISGDADSSGDATVSKSNVPEGIYDIKLGGKIKDTSKPVTLKVYASTKITADEDGNFEYQYSTDAIDEGTTIYLNIGGVTKEVTVQGTTPAPVVPTTNITEEDTTPPVIKVLEPLKSEYAVNSIDFNIAVTDDSDFDFNIYLNNKELTYSNNGKYFTGTLSLVEGKNTLKIGAEDEYGNKNTKIVYVTYSKDLVENSGDTGETEESETNGSSNDESSEDEKNTVLGTIIFNVGSALLTINDGTEISTGGDIEIEEIEIPETSMAYIIYPEDSEFSIPLTLEIDVSELSGNLKVIYYDSEKGWVNTKYVLSDDTITVNVTKSGYYAVKETETVEENDSIFDVIKGILNAIKIILTAIIDRI